MIIQAFDAKIKEDCGYHDIAFVDDNSKLAIGKITDLKQMREYYTEAFVGIGKNALRKSLILQLRELNYKIPLLIHSSAYISRSCVVEAGVIVEPKAIINAHSIIEEGTIISVGAVVNHDVKVEKYCHVNSGAFVKADVEIEDCYKLESGEVVLGYEAVIIKR